MKYISIRELNKTYRAKGCAAVPALRGVSFDLPEKGMVFILGKSGCGKSTLLNVLGGLDNFDGGDVIIDGKSMKDFSAKDTDRHRNEKVGFVFQENNLLDEYTVGRNVSLALELINVKDGGDKVAAALNSVELSDFGDRKCNRLSGGQKQRVAIARAIVKKPEILLCDEPTGALDSDTGEEIFNLLKNISNNTLVIVVSHDRESAEKYGDRVIELKDGQVISDSAPAETKHTETETEPEVRKKSYGLPAKRAFSIGANFLIARPVRLALCIFICLVTFICVGISDTFASYNREKVIVDNLKLYETPFLSYTLNTGFYGENNKLEYGFNNQTKVFDNTGYERLKSLLKGERFDRFYNFSTTRLSYDFGTGRINELKDREDIYFNESFMGMIEMDEKLSSDYGFKLYGDYPKNYGEAVIPEYIFHWFQLKGYTPDYESAPDNVTAISEYSDIIGKNITVKIIVSRDSTSLASSEINLNFKIVGVLDTKLNESIYNDILYRELKGNDRDKYAEINSAFYVLNNYGMHSALFTSSGFFEKVYRPQLLEIYSEENKNAGYIKSVISPVKGSAKDLMSNAGVHKKYQDTKVDGSGTETGWFSHYTLSVDASSVVDDKHDTMLLLKTIFFYVALGTSVISALFIFYFTSGVVTEKKREIGILRAIGASRGDIFKIFAAENGIFAGGLIALATVFTAIADVIANTALTKGFGVKAALLTFSVRQFAVIAAVTVLAVALGVIIPVVKMLCAKPVDIISGRK